MPKSAKSESRVKSEKMIGKENWFSNEAKYGDDKEQTVWNLVYRAADHELSIFKGLSMEYEGENCRKHEESEKKEEGMDE